MQLGPKYKLVGVGGLWVEEAGDGGGTAECPGLCNVGHVPVEEASKQSAEVGKKKI